MRNLSSPFLVKPFAVRPPRPWTMPPPTRLKIAASAISRPGEGTIAPSVAPSEKEVEKSDDTASTYKSLLSSTSLPIYELKASTFRTFPELGLLSLVFVLSMAIGSFFAVAIVSIPTMNALRRLATSMVDLYNVAAKEVPGNFSSFKLSSLEIGELTQRVSNLRKTIAGSHGKKEKGSESGRKSYHIKKDKGSTCYYKF